MKVRDLLPGLLAAFLLAFAACGDDDDATRATPAATDAGAYPVTVTGDNGVQITFDEQPQRIVAMAPSFVEVLYAIGAGDAIVAADENTDYPPEAAAIPKLSGFAPSVEGIASYEPDLVLITFDPGGLIDALNALSIDVMFLSSPATIEGALTQIETLGMASGHASEAADLVAGMRADIDAIKAELPGDTEGPEVYHEVDNTYYSAGPGSFIHDLYATLGARNIAEATGEAFPQLSAEAIIEADPEVIILADEFAGESADTVAARAGWGGISAVAEGRVYTVDPNIISRPGPRLVEALETLAKLLYPEAF